MFIYNLKLNGKNITKAIFIAIAIIITIFFIIATFKIYKGNFNVKDKNKNDISYIETKNYTNVLKSVHENLDNYIGKKICFSGYVYKLNDFKSNEFVLARDMIISSDMQTLIVGFLCDSQEASNFENNCWVKITGEITKGDYHGDIPIIKVSKIDKIEKPTEDIYVYPPDDSYVPTFSSL
jgi:putative membrane protein